MVSSFFWLFIPLNMVPSVAVNAAYTIHAQPVAPVANECCGRCKNGVITHGDGHTTPCPCPADCKCKTKGAVVHPPICVSGTCKPKPSK
jgi:hypothetical protein